MTTEKVSEWRAVRRERERERRRMRDRQKRQSMSLEDREKHLARRRRNYQLRRQRAENAYLDSEDEQIRIASGGAETGAYKSEKTPRRLRLHQIRHLARLLNTSKGESSCTSQQIGEDVIMKDGVAGTCGSRKSLRLIHVKCLARALNSSVKENADQNHLTEACVKHNPNSERPYATEYDCFHCTESDGPVGIFQDKGVF